MEDKDSCLMLMANLETPLSIASILEEGDVKEIIYDSNVTIFYANDPVIDRKDLVYNLPNDKLRIQKDEEENLIPVLDLFELGSFENDDSDFLVLKMKTGSEWYDMVTSLNSKLVKIYGIKESFETYNPHVTLAELIKGTAKKYLDSTVLRKVISNSMIHFEDFALNQYNLTNFCGVDRFFRIRERKEIDNEL